MGLCELEILIRSLRGIMPFYKTLQMSIGFPVMQVDIPMSTCMTEQLFVNLWEICIRSRTGIFKNEPLISLADRAGYDDLHPARRGTVAFADHPFP